MTPGQAIYERLSMGNTVVTWRTLTQKERNEWEARARDTIRQETSWHQSQVQEFMVLAGQEVPSIPTMPNDETRLLRARLIIEEALETVRDLGVQVILSPGFDVVKMEFLQFVNAFEPNLIGIIDGCCDIAVVTTGTLSACGIVDVPFQAEVNMNNLAKFGPGGRKNEAGKWLKPPGHKPPDIQRLLRERGWREPEVKAVTSE